MVDNLKSVTIKKDVSLYSWPHGVDPVAVISDLLMKWLQPQEIQILVWKLLEEGRMTVLGSIPFRKIENLFKSDLYEPTELVFMDRLKVFPLESRPY